MRDEKNLDILLQNIQPILHEDIYVFATVDHNYNIHDIDYVCVFKERKGLTLILPMQEALLKEIPYIYTSRMITLNIHSGLDAVGFLAHISSTLADAGISVNAVSAYYHDYNFVPDHKADKAIDILKHYKERLTA